MDAKYTTHWILVFVLAACISKATCLYGWDSSCGSTKGCFPDCPGGCHYLVTWEDKGANSIKFSVKAEKSQSSDSYLAIAFSDDRRMGDDSVVACFGSSIESSYNSGTDNDVLSPKTYGISNISVGVNRGDIWCSFSRQTNTSNSRFFDLNNDYYIQLVTGKMESKKGETKLKKHDEIPWFSERKVDFQSHDIVGAYKLNSPLVKLHGSMMVLGWLLFSLVGIMTARFNKDMMPDTKLFGTKVWFQVHRALMVMVVVCVVVGFITIFVEIDGYSQVTPGEGGFVEAHPVLGIVITCLALLNPIGALFRPGPDHKFRWLFNWAHLGLGVIGQFLAVLTIFFGYFADRSCLSSAPAIVTGVHLCVVIFFVVFYEVRKRTQAGRQAVENGDVKKGENLKEEHAKPKIWNDPLITLVVFTIFTCGFAVAVVAIIGAS